MNIAPIHSTDLNRWSRYPRQDTDQKRLSTKNPIDHRQTPTFSPTTATKPCLNISSLAFAVLFQVEFPEPNTKDKQLEVCKSYLETNSLFPSEQINRQKKLNTLK